MMEVSCPNCSQRLRYSDQLVNPLLRCRNCLTTFRPAETLAAVEEPVAAVAVDEYDPAREEQFRRFAAGPSQQPVAESPSTRWFGKSGMGSIGVIALVIAFKAGPRLLREVLRERKPDRPVQMRNDERQAIEKLVHNAAENAAARKRVEPPPMPAAPNRVLPTDP